MNEAQTQPKTENNSSNIKVMGEELDKLPEDLYIPPDAMRVFLEAFEGPLDLLLYLIKKQNIDILNIPILEITKQYVHYIEVMQHLELELAAEYLVMAAMLAEIKSRMLIPKPRAEEDEGDDPRADLIRRLQEYERYKKAASDLDELPQVDRDTIVARAILPSYKQPQQAVTVELDELAKVLFEVLERAKLFTNHQVEREILSIRQRMTHILERITPDEFIAFGRLYAASEGRMGVVVTLVALLELLRQKIVMMEQAEAFAPIYLKAVKLEEKVEDVPA